MSQSVRLPTNAVVFIGDSRTPQLGIRTLCGRPVLLAGVGGYGLIDLHWLTLALSKTSNAKIILINAGVNDAIADRKFDPIEWKRELTEDVKSLETSFTVITVSIIPNATSGVLGGTYLNISRVNQMNDIAEDTSPIFIDTRQDMTDASGRLRAEFTTDGIHFSDSGNAAYLASVSKRLCPEN